MGCCFSSDDDRISQSGEPNERTTLLGNPVSNTGNRISYSDDYGTQPKPPYNQKGDEQAALNRILHQTACSIIDVSAMNTYLEQREYLDRARLYSQRMNAVPWHFPSKASKNLLSDLPAPEKLLSADPLPLTDIQLINEACDQIAKALQEVKVKHKEDLVVQFGIP